MIRQLTVAAPKQGLHEITSQINQLIDEAAVDNGLCTIFIQHTSASLLIQENADADVCLDLENFFNKLAPPDKQAYTHTNEGPDDMPAHIKSTLTSTSLTIPIVNGRAALGTWQGIFLWEHKRSARPRTLIMHLQKD